MERALTVRQKLFAAGVAQGLSRTAAHAVAYPNNMKRGTREVAAKQTAKIPRVKAEIDRLTVAMLPPVEDMRKAYHHALSTVLRLTLEAKDERLRFDAARFLIAEYQRTEQMTKEEPACVPVQKADILAELRGLYELALGPRPVQNPLVVEVGAEADPTEADHPPPETSEPSEPVSVGQESGFAEREAPMDLPHGGPVFRREPIPGTFPPQFRKVRVK